MEGDHLNIIKNIIKNELYLFAFLIFSEVLRLFMKAGEYLSIDFIIAIIMVIAVAILSVIQQLVNETLHKNRASLKS